MSIKNNNPRVAFELLCLLDEICRKNNIKYTLTEETLLGAILNKGFLDYSHTAYVAMRIDEYNRFLKVCKTELEGAEYYTVNYKDRSDIEEVYTYLLKRSRVKLPKHRKQDEFYYDFFIKIIPVFYSSDDFKVHRKMKKRYNRFKKIVDARGMNLRIFKNSWRYMKNARNLKYNRKKVFKLMTKCLENGKDKKQNVIYINHKKNGNSSVNLASTYFDYTEIEFENKKFKVIKEYREWLLDFYGEKKLENIEEEPFNAMLMKGPEELRRVQLVQLDILKEVDRICRKHKIDYFICSGTLLGAVRHGGFIPWDYDADLAMHKEDYDKFLEVCKKEMDKDKYFVRNIKSEPTIHITYTQIRRLGTKFIRAGRENNKKANHGILVDVFPLYKGGNNLVSHTIQKKIALFAKTAFWTHNGANSEKQPMKRCYYKVLAKMPPQIFYDLYMKYAKKYENTNTSKVAWLVAWNNPFNSVFTDLNLYDKYQDIEFEGYKFKTIKENKQYLAEVYKEPGVFLPERRRVNGFLSSAFDAGDLFPYDD